MCKGVKTIYVFNKPDSVSKDPINNMSALFQIMAWRRKGDISWPKDDLNYIYASLGLDGLKNIMYTIMEFSSEKNKNKKWSKRLQSIYLIIAWHDDRLFSHIS